MVCAVVYDVPKDGFTSVGWVEILAPDGDLFWIGHLRSSRLGGSFGL